VDSLVLQLWELRGLFGTDARWSSRRSRHNLLRVFVDRDHRRPFESQTTSDICPMNIQCSQFKNGICRIATTIAGTSAPPLPGEGCHVCSSFDVDSQAINRITVSAAIQAVRHDQQAMQRILRDYDSYLRVEPKPGVGRFLSRLFKARSYVPNDTCPCLDIADEMSERGPDACEQDIEHYTDAICEEARKRNWLKLIAATPIASQLLRIEIKQLIRTAIRATRAEALKTENECPD
jgi:hypothetical protein